MDQDRSFTKEDIVKAVSTLPEDATVEDAMERLYVLAKVEIGLRQSREGKSISLDEFEARLAKKKNSEP